MVEWEGIEPSLGAAVLFGGLLLAFRRSRRLTMPPQEVLDRVKVRERALEERDRIERGD